MIIVDIDEAQARLSQLVERTCHGEEILIAQAGVCVARLVPMAKVSLPRSPGGWEGLVEGADDFDDPLPEWTIG